MGCIGFRGRSSYTPPADPKLESKYEWIGPNPNPKNFKIINAEVFTNKACVLIVNYPDSTNFEGNKVLVYRNWKEVGDWVKQFNQLDPHFHDTFLSPVARFIPTAEGTRLARELAKSL